MKWVNGVDGDVDGITHNEYIPAKNANTMLGMLICRFFFIYCRHLNISSYVCGIVTNEIVRPYQF